MSASEPSKAAPKPSTFPFGNCRVCSDKATGIHYGVSTCEGCKGFFKRSILKKELYKCFLSEKCTVNPKNRNKCKSCRFKKCVRMGMSFTGIKMGRIPKAEKEKALKNLQQNLAEKDEEEHHKVKEEVVEKTHEAEPAKKGGATATKTVKKKKKTKTLVLPKNSTNVKSHTKNDSNEHKLHTAVAVNHRMIEYPVDVEQSELSESSKRDKNKKRKPSNEDKQFAFVYLNKFSKFVHTDSVKKRAKLNSLTANADRDKQSSAAASHDKDDYLLKFFWLLQENKISMDMIETSKRQQQMLASKTLRCQVESLKETADEEREREATASSDEISTIEGIMGNKRSFSPHSLIPNTFYSNLFTSTLAPCDHSNQLIISMLNDKIYQLFIENTQGVYALHSKVCQNLAINGGAYMREFVKVNNKREVNEVVSSLLRVLPNALTQCYDFGRHLPGLNELNSADFNVIIEKKIFDYFMIFNSILFIDGESYMYLTEDIIFSRYWQNVLRTKEIVDPLFEFMASFNSLELTKKEKALLMPLIFTMPSDVNVKDHETLRDLNEYYTRAILYEFDLNHRNYEFLMNLKKALNLLMYCRKTHAYD